MCKVLFSYLGRLLLGQVEPVVVQNFGGHQGSATDTDPGGIGQACLCGLGPTSGLLWRLDLLRLFFRRLLSL
jgi:hypothetical protein